MDDNKLDNVEIDNLTLSKDELEMPVVKPTDYISTTKKEKLIIPIEDVIGISPTQYKTYYEMEGNLFPDLWRRSEKTDDVDSKTKYIAFNRINKIYTALILEHTKTTKRTVGLKIFSTNELMKNFERYIKKEKSQP